MPKIKTVKRCSASVSFRSAEGNAEGSGGRFGSVGSAREDRAGGQWLGTPDFEKPKPPRGMYRWPPVF